MTPENPQQLKRKVTDCDDLTIDIERWVNKSAAIKKQKKLLEDNDRELKKKKEKIHELQLAHERTRQSLVKKTEESLHATFQEFSSSNQYFQIYQGFLKDKGQNLLFHMLCRRCTTHFPPRHPFQCHYKSHKLWQCLLLQVRSQDAQNQWCK
jgi:hypothetical protein